MKIAFGIESIWDFEDRFHQYLHDALHLFVYVFIHILQTVGWIFFSKT